VTLRPVLSEQVALFVEVKTVFNGYFYNYFIEVLENMQIISEIPGNYEVLAMCCIFLGYFVALLHHDVEQRPDGFFLGL